MIIISGIYKITNPSGKIYIGQSINIYKRWKKYKSLTCKNQTILYNSFVKYGVDNHIFEIIEVCDVNLLNEKERFYQEFYNCIGNNGLNCKLQSTNILKTVHSEETKKRISNSKIGKKLSEECKIKMSNSRKNKKQSKQHIENRFKSRNGFKHSEESKKKMSINNKKLNLGKKDTLEVRLKKIKNNAMSKIILNTETGIYYDSISSASDSCGIPKSTLVSRLNGNLKNKTPFINV